MFRGVFPGGCLVLPITCLISLGADVFSEEGVSRAAQPAPATPVELRTIQPLPVDLPVTNGLIRWWPNLFDVRDEITGQEGVVMGLLPPVAPGAEDETEFGAKTAWVQLQPAITNEVFTLCFWASCRKIGPTSSLGSWPRKRAESSGFSRRPVAPSTASLRAIISLNQIGSNA